MSDHFQFWVEQDRICKDKYKDEPERVGHIVWEVLINAAKEGHERESD
jgi:hypothetical protein